MREYSSVSPAFWIGKTGKELRGNMPAQLLALYLMTSPHSTMTGVFHCPVLYMAHETGMTMEGATEALARLIQAGFCEYEEDTETIFVVRMAAFQIAERLKPGDKRILGMPRHVDSITSPFMRERFIATYSEAFCLHLDKPLRSPSEAPAKPGTGTGTGTGGEGLEQPPSDSPESPPPVENEIPEKQNQEDTQTSNVTMAGAVCIALKSVGMSGVNPGNQSLKNLIEAGVDLGVFVEVGRECVRQQKPFSYLLAAVKGRMSDSQAMADQAIAKAQPTNGILPGAI